MAWFLFSFQEWNKFRAHAFPLSSADLAAPQKYALRGLGMISEWCGICRGLQIERELLENILHHLYENWKAI